MRYFKKTLAALAVVLASVAVHADPVGPGAVPCGYTTCQVTKLGIGMTPTNILDITQNQNAPSIGALKNTSTGTGAVIYYAATNGTSQTILGHFGTAYTSSGMNRQNGGIIQSDGAGGLTFNTAVAQPVYFGINNALVGGFNAVGYFRADTSGNASTFNSTTEHRIATNGKSAGQTLLYVYDNASGGDFGIWYMGANGYSLANTGVTVGKDTTTGRSINAGGTINASGADYAEYELKELAADEIAKGQIVGFNADGKITTHWKNSISFGIKSTSPSYVGGDTWGMPSKLGLTVSKKDSPLKKQELRSALAEAERGVDLIAYSGKVPVNVIGAKPGDYIIAISNGDEINGEALANPSFEEYERAVGRVRRILPDGRAEVAVIVH